ncbi:pH adaption potassium efflux system protein PhaG [Roseovarius sp. TM1035]|jgi:multicomponent K+:H+ antiporter subunit G|uniref:Na(+)/H(+) antiporter subunit G n=1 Tax=Roseovarius mucosus TaxID=215743 RepID=A0A1V0RNV3_9RHOB|nr:MULTISPECIES: Na+/H+ antiporter subunit G [Roseovarius]ARE83469.1 Na(+)/H(+) antiporter subunit G [Roseovarius mucosus]AWZ19902.1 Na(+) H(+) antiporter subunit G [Roseovarius sp. AK1035]EDM31422.1 pH adaption potassium efflux system protein PhaG [Roseovarius sp. TM1035]MBW4973017.1 Na+/H+ antiporter subunit G [Roseovarius mucosus]
MVVDILISACLVISGVFGLVGSFGLIKLPDPMMRLHAPTKATTLGVGGALIASMMYFYFVVGQFSFHELMITLFLLLTAPITGHFIAKTHLHLVHKPSDLPPTGTDRPWASYESDAERARIEAEATGPQNG